MLAAFFSDDEGRDYRGVVWTCPSISWPKFGVNRCRCAWVSCFRTSACTSSRKKRTCLDPFRILVSCAVPAPPFRTVFLEQPMISATCLASIRVFLVIKLIVGFSWKSSVDLFSSYLVLSFGRHVRPASFQHVLCHVPLASKVVLYKAAF